MERRLLVIPMLALTAAAVSGCEPSIRKLDAIGLRNTPSELWGRLRAQDSTGGDRRTPECWQVLIRVSYRPLPPGFAGFLGERCSSVETNAVPRATHRLTAFSDRQPAGPTKT